MKVKKEVKDLFIEFKNEKIGSKRWHEIEKILQSKYKFTAFNLLALWGNPPTIEYNDDNFSLVLEREKSNF